MSDTDVKEVPPVTDFDALSKELEPDSPDDGSVRVGPAEAVTDSRLMPCVTAEEELAYVHGEDLDDHPDNTSVQDAPVPDAGAGEALPGDDELAGLVADVDADAVDGVGFDETDVEGAADIASLPDPEDGA